ncbi:hypothetical protein [Crocosphaera sp. XPORK-15E]|uniref:hypothetical protein n=1 Tax=Crocosphaera sp. XPORK-15E TaxID=3110247 RepID=UPI002B1FEAAD|nr:hypothetical protein [Crocosphaera sp. XPORK-15E]MEA5537125.1 hypothetical protein [Crocosphaera sp. XPORK-15E]
MKPFSTISQFFFCKSLQIMALIGTTVIVPNINIPTSFAVTINPGEGLIFGQLDLLYTNVQQLDSFYGLAGGLSRHLGIKCIIRYNT